jgi:hypothetical protein
VILKLKHVKALIEMFSEDERTEITLTIKTDKTICPDSKEEMPPGLYAHYTEYPEEGAMLIDDGYEYVELESNERIINRYQNDAMFHKIVKTFVSLIVDGRFSKEKILEILYDTAQILPLLFEGNKNHNAGLNGYELGKVVFDDLLEN